jgi:tetratricopeptide (TPR) repeat protein
MDMKATKMRRMGAHILGGGMAILLTLAIAACGNDGQERVPLEGPGSLEEMESELPAEIQEQLDSANTAYRSGEYDEALALFQEVTEMAPGLAAGWYGVGMTHQAMGDTEAAEAAMMEVHQLAPDLPLQHPGPDAAPANPHPATPNPHANPPTGQNRSGGSSY